MSLKCELLKFSQSSTYFPASHQNLQSCRQNVCSSFMGMSRSLVWKPQHACLQIKWSQAWQSCENGLFFLPTPQGHSPALDTESGLNRSPIESKVILNVMECIFELNANGVSEQRLLQKKHCNPNARKERIKKETARWWWRGREWEQGLGSDISLQDSDLSQNPRGLRLPRLGRSMSKQLPSGEQEDLGGRQNGKQCHKVKILTDWLEEKNRGAKRAEPTHTHS